MEEQIFKIFSIFLLTMLKFIAGPTLGYAGGFSFFTTVLLSVGGMMASVFLFTFLGKLLRQKVLVKIFSKRKTFTKKNRRFVTIWKKYGLVGVAFLTPVLLSPIVGTIILASFESRKSRILLAMLGSATFWAVIISAVVYLLGPELFSNFVP